METLIRLFDDFANGPQGKRETYLPADFGGTIPGIGDIIVDPLCQQGRNPSDPIGRTLYEVVGRYFAPRADLPTLVHLLVRPRAGRFEERVLVGE
jgi:hypothetical protein